MPLFFAVLLNYEPIVDPSFGVIIHNVLGEATLDIRSVHDGLRWTSKRQHCYPGMC